MPQVFRGGLQNGSAKHVTKHLLYWTPAVWDATRMLTITSTDRYLWCGQWRVNTDTLECFRSFPLCNKLVPAHIRPGHCCHLIMPTTPSPWSHVFIIFTALTITTISTNSYPWRRRRYGDNDRKSSRVDISRDGQLLSHHSPHRTFMYHCQLTTMGSLPHNEIPWLGRCCHGGYVGKKTE